jgi:hypothetical protein
MEHDADACELELEPSVELDTEAVEVVERPVLEALLAEALLVELVEMLLEEMTAVEVPDGLLDVTSWVDVDDELREAGLAVRKNAPSKTTTTATAARAITGVRAAAFLVVINARSASLMREAA